MNNYGSSFSNFNYQSPVNNADEIMNSLTNWASPGQNLVSQTNSVGNATSPFWSWDSFLGTGTQNGWGVPALEAGQGLFNSWLGLKQYGLARDQFRENRRQFNQNFEAQRTLTNSRLEDRQRARVASNPTAYQSVGDYLDQNRI